MSINSSQFESHKILRYLDIVLPSPGGLVFYIFLSLTTLVVHYVDSIQHFLDLSGNFAIRSNVLNFLNNLLVSVFGIKLSNTLVLALFWGFVGLVVYVFVQGFAVVVKDLGQDLEERRYILPQGVNRNKPLERDLERAAFRTAVGILFLYYLINVFGYFLRGRMYGVAPAGYWAHLGSGIKILVLLAGECLALHGIVIFLRLLLLRRRVLG